MMTHLSWKLERAFSEQYIYIIHDTVNFRWVTVQELGKELGKELGMG